MIKSIISKMDLFTEGWNLHCEGLMMPAGTMKDGKMKTWEELLEPLIIFECKAFGESEGQAYLKSVGIQIE